MVITGTPPDIDSPSKIWVDFTSNTGLILQKSMNFLSLPTTDYAMLINYFDAKRALRNFSRFTAHWT